MTKSKKASVQRLKSMVFGIGNKKSLKKPAQTSKSAKSKSTQASEAAAILKKMEDKKKSGECAFC